MPKVVHDHNELRNLNPQDAPDRTVVLLGFYGPSDGGDGTFFWDRDTDRHDIGVHVRPTGHTTGAWTRVVDGPINVKWFGAWGDQDPNPPATPSDTQLAIQRAIDYAATAHTVPGDPNYQTFAKIYFPSNVTSRRAPS